jgi:hypothetical protein
VTATALLDRDRELAALDALTDDARAGRGRLVHIEGPAGIGKSGLLADLRERAAAGSRVLAARASELEREFAFGIVRQLFETEVAERGERALAGAAAPAAAVFTSAPTHEGEAAASFAALHGLYWLTLNLAAETPLVLAVDDVHWCDRPSLRFLAYLSRRLDGMPALVALTLRSAGRDRQRSGHGRDPAGTSRRRSSAGARPRRAGRRGGAGVLRGLSGGDGRQPTAPAPAAAHARG